jgi:hypothetical protein
MCRSNSLSVTHQKWDKLVGIEGFGGLKRNGKGGSLVTRHSSLITGYLSLLTGHLSLVTPSSLLLTPYSLSAPKP